ncbi:hypothetical protein ACE6H2_010622 [Prunus campanulata]
MNLAKYKFPLCHPEELLNYHRNGIVMPSHETERKVSMKITQIDDNNNEVDLGFSPRTNEYKVMRILKEQTPNPNKVAEIHTLGTGSWKSVGTARCSDSELSFPTCVKGMLYWFCDKWSGCSVISFDLDTEEFQSVPSLPFEDGYDVSMGDLGGIMSLSC